MLSWENYYKKKQNVFCCLYTYRHLLPVTLVKQRKKHLPNIQWKEIVVCILCNNALRFCTEYNNTVFFIDDQKKMYYI